MDSSELSYEDISEPYYFESDHVALRENADYRNLLHTVAILEAQRQQAAQDIEQLHKAQEEALANPLNVVEKLQQGRELGFPKPQKVARLPDIQWDQYTSSTNFSMFGNSRHMTRNKKNAGEGGVDQMQNLKSKLIQGLSAPSSSTANMAHFQQQVSDSDVVLVRGRTRDSSKPATFNQLWTEEEQQRLESLLIQFPPEEVESRRWAKIADTLGNRTPVQVASRVQKYFLKLAKEGLPIPGRMPNVTAYTKRSSHRHHRYNRLYYPNSTFLQSHLPPVWMKEDGDEYDMLQQDVNGSGVARDARTMSEAASMEDESSDDDSFPEELKNTPEYKELKRLQRLKRDKQAKQRTVATKHIGYKCDSCGCEPIVGSRWHCIDCPADQSLDFCDNCSNISYHQGKHDSSHRLHPYRHATVDSDYMGYTKTDYNYLDPNYMPAS